MGLRSMKVRRLREENASRARELWMKAQSAAAGQKIRDKKMLAAAIKIQVFRLHDGRLPRISYVGAYPVGAQPYYGENVSYECCPQNNTWYLLSNDVQLLTNVNINGSAGEFLPVRDSSMARFFFTASLRAAESCGRSTFG